MSRQERKRFAKSLQDIFPLAFMSGATLVIDPLPYETEDYWRTMVNAIYAGADQVGVKLRILGAPTLEEWRILRRSGRAFEIK